MSGRVIIREAAKRDVAEQWDYLRDRSPDAAERYVAAVRAMFERLVATPGMGPLRNYGNAALSGMRMKPVAGFGKYLIYYRPVDGGIEIIRVLHSARNIAAILRKER